MRNNFYESCERIGLNKENNQYKEKYEYFLYLKNIVEKFTNEKVIFDCFRFKDTGFKIYFTFTGFGPYIYIPYKNIVCKTIPFILKQPVYLSHDWMSERYEKYNDSEYSNIKNSVAFLPNFNNIKSINFKKVSDFIFDYDGYIKPHPLTSTKTLDLFRYKFDNRIIDSKYAGFSILKNASNVGITSNTELGIIAYLLNKNIFDLDTDEYYLNGSSGSYISFYKVIKEKQNLNHFLNTFLSGLIPWKYCDDEKILYRLLNFMKQFYENNKK